MMVCLSPWSHIHSHFKLIIWKGLHMISLKLFNLFFLKLTKHLNPQCQIVLTFTKLHAEDVWKVQL